MSAPVQPPSIDPTTAERVSQVQILVTERCNIQCRHCAVPTEESPAERELTTEQWANFLQIAGEAGVDSVVLNGGEAFIRKDTLALAERAFESGIRWVIVITNGMLFNRATAERVAELQSRWPQFGIHISVDGASPETHDWMRGTGSFARMTASVQRLLDAGGRVEGVNSVVHRGNLHEFELLAELVASWSATMWTVFPNADLGRGVALGDYRLAREAWLDLYARASHVKERLGLYIGIGGPVMVDEWPEDDELVPTPLTARPDKTCIGPDGAVFTCPPLRGETLGQALEVEDAAAWQAISASAARTLNRSCESCKYLLVCTNVNIDKPLRPRQGRFGPPASQLGLPALRRAPVPVRLVNRRADPTSLTRAQSVSTDASSRQDGA